MFRLIYNIWLTIRLFKNWPQILLVRNLAQLRLRSGQQFAVNQTLGRAELSMLLDIWGRQVYDRVFAIGKHDVVVDVGANKGYFTVYASIQASKGRVFAFEPVPFLLEALAENIKLNQLSNVEIISKALWETAGRYRMYLTENIGGHSLYQKPWSKGELEIETMTLEQFMLDHGLEKINFLKLDCEGAEYNILLNIKPEILKRIEKIALEYHNFGVRSHHQLVDCLRQAGFDVKVAGAYIYAQNKDF
ncbi:MAG: FkbM family methyltransferase [Candidatus Doudnabacteria bacterium]|nr:FkbM family methyltransferase [Candidatus Doudnabacteria bacterium]